MGARFACGLVTLLGLATACTKADIYASSGEDLAADRLTITGQLCTEDTAGARFPVKVLLLIDGSLGMFTADPNAERLAARHGVRALLARYRDQAHVSFGFVALGDSSTAVPQPNGQRFFRPADPEVEQAIAALQQPLGMRRSIEAAIAQAESFITSDIAGASAGATLRTRYLVYLLVAGPPAPAEPLAVLAHDVEHLRALVRAQGALELRFDVGYLYYGPRTLDRGDNPYRCFSPGDAAAPACSCDPTAHGSASYCAVLCDAPADETAAEQARSVYQSIATVGEGAFVEFPCATSVNLDAAVATPSVRLVKKDLFAFNRSMRLTPAGPATDSDGDGLSDEEEGIVGTDPLLYDTDGDGLGDGLELRAAPVQNPLDPRDRPSGCVDPALVTPLPDRDLDLLNDCEEGLLLTNPTLPDSDGDGLIDSLEFLTGMVPTSASDRLLDFDGDGVANGAEVLAHTDARGNDGALGQKLGYRTSVTSLGFRPVAAMEDSVVLPGVFFKSAGPGVVGGQAVLIFDACANTLAWSDARRQSSPALEPLPVALDHGRGLYTLPAQATLADGTIVAEASIEVEVYPELLPLCAGGGVITATPLVSVSMRSCYDLRVSNIKLVLTRAADGAPAGENHVLVSFTSTPMDRLTSPSLASLAEVRVRLACTDPNDMSTCARQPAGNIELTDADFVSAAP